MKLLSAKTILILSVLFFLSSFPSAKAVGIKVSPAKIDEDVVQSGGELQLLVTNPSNNVEVYQVYADDFQELFKINPESFTLEAGGEKVVSIQLQSQSRGTVISTNLSVVSKNLTDTQLAAATGVKIPVTIRYDGSGFKWYFRQNLRYMVGAALLFILVVSALVYRRKGKRRKLSSENPG